VVRIMVTGSRDHGDHDFIFKALDEVAEGAGTVLLLEGGAPGADHRARQWALANGHPFQTFHADWGTYGRAAGPLRNQRMIDEGEPDLVVAFPLEDSRGTWDAVRRAKAAGIPVEAFV